MTSGLTIGVVARQSGLSVDTVRFYEAKGIIPAPARTPAGYRLYSHADVRRLRLARRARLLGMELAGVRSFVEQAFASDCSTYMTQLLDRIARQRAAVRRQIDELVALEGELTDLAEHVRHAQTAAAPGRRVADCGFCPLIDDDGGNER